jgi:hypothetical protein
MLTQTDLNQAFAATIAATAPLDADDLLRRARRRRGTRRLLASGGATTGALALAGVLALAAWTGRAAGGAAVVAQQTLPAGDVVAASAPGRSFTVEQAPPHQDADLKLLREDRAGKRSTVALINQHRGVSVLPEWTGVDGRTLRTVKVGTMTAEVLEWTAKDGRYQQVQWLAKGSRFTISTFFDNSHSDQELLDDEALKGLIPKLVR